MAEKSKYEIGDILLVTLKQTCYVLRETVIITDIKYFDAPANKYYYNTKVLYSNDPTVDLSKREVTQSFVQGSAYYGSAVKINNGKAAKVLFEGV